MIDEREKLITLTEAQMEAIILRASERAAEIALERLEVKVLAVIGKTFLEKFFYIVGVSVLIVYAAYDAIMEGKVKWPLG